VDVLRGLILVLMALDHANLYVAKKHPRSEFWVGAFPAYENALAFLTRLVGHLCAPGFFFLMGVGMVLLSRSRQERGWSRRQVLCHLGTRGGVLIGLQVLLALPDMLAPTGFSFAVGVFFALGVTMVLGSLVLGLRPVYLLGCTAALLIVTELLVLAPDHWRLSTGPFSPLLTLPGTVAGPGGLGSIRSNFPVLPWLPFVTFGLAYGHWLANDPQRAYRRAWKLGAAFLVAFVVVRALDGYGNLRPRMGDTWIDFLNVVKYPPSLSFALLTMGVNLILLWTFSQIQRRHRRRLRPLAVLGRASLFFYLIHVAAYRVFGRLLTPAGTSIPAMYPIWLLGLLLIYPVCLFYGRFKLNQPPQSFWRFL
jgi:uncharacterized membrane protein